MSEAAPLRSRLPKKSEATPDALLEAFLDYAAGSGLELYAAQEEAILELFSGANVILNTPTGSGKSLVAEAMHFRALALDEVSFYTAPIKALVSEKFFALCRRFGPADVGMMTGDAAVNPDAPILCCTAEILANLALREGALADVQHVVMDEFHYYGDRDRGWAWQVPLLTMPQARFLLMSATLGDTARFVDELQQRTGAPTKVVRSAERPVPLDFEYRMTPLQRTVQDLLDEERAPVYIVHFSQRAASEQAQNLTSIDFLSKPQKQAIREALRGFRFDTPFGKTLRKYLTHGIGVHHAGLLPKYRLLVEKLAQQGHLKLICGTDTLGVGVNIPIRTVHFTKLCKFDGEQTRLLRVRDFKQIAGRAGRKGFDARGSVVAQAPEHVIENKALEDKAAGDPKKLRKLVRRKPPTKGYAHWDEATFERLIASEPEPLESRFDVSHAMLLHMLERPGDGCRAIRDLIRDCHDREALKRRHRRQAMRMFRSLVGAGVVDLLPAPDADGRKVALNEHLQANFSLNQALSLWVVEVLQELDPESPDYALDVISMVEAVQENPKAVLLKQLDKLKKELVNELKAEGVEYEDRMAELDKLEWPKPQRDFIYGTFNRFAEKHPWVGENIRPKSIVRDMWELSAGFRDYVKEYGLQRSEGVLLRYLSDVYKAVIQTVPDRAKTDDVDELIEWLGTVVRGIDASLLDEWERLKDPERAKQAAFEEEPLPDEGDVTADHRQFGLLLRNAMFRLARLLAKRDYEALADSVTEPQGEPRWTPERLEQEAQRYWDRHEALRIDADARNPKWLRVDEDADAWWVRQTLLDPEGDAEFWLEARIDREASRGEQRPVIELLGLREA